jgi:phage gp46-like protein
MWGLLYNNAAQRADLTKVPNGPYILDPGLETAVTISLFSDAQPEGDPAPAPGDMRRGWWADAYPLDANEAAIGSRLWSRRRSGPTADVLAQIGQDAEDALQWLVADGVANAVAVAATAIGATGVLLNVSITRPGNPEAWSKVWQVPNALG